jgi:hypothetical protein
VVDATRHQPSHQVRAEIRMRHAPQVGAITPEEMGESVLLPLRECPIEPA